MADSCPPPVPYQWTFARFLRLGPPLAALRLLEVGQGQRFVVASGGYRIGLAPHHKNVF